MENKINKKVLNLSKKEILIPVCPEQLGGLATPREAVVRKGKKVFTTSGQDISLSFDKGHRKF